MDHSIDINDKVRTAENVENIVDYTTKDEKVAVYSSDDVAVYHLYVKN